jgi:hypothetical protein
LRGFYELELIDPKGNIIVLGSTIGGFPVQRLQRYNYTIYRVIFPDVEEAFNYVGDWILRLTPNGKWNPKDAREALGLSREVTDRQQQSSVGFLNPIEGLVPIGFAAAVASNYRLAVEVLPSGYLPGANVTLTASLSDRGWPAVEGRVTVDVTTPSGIEYKGIELYDDGTRGDAEAGDGTWTNHFTHTSESGSYKFFFRALGRNDRGELAPREDTRYLTLIQPTKDPDPSDRSCIPCQLQRWLWTIVLGLLLLIVFILLRQG